MRYTFVSSFLPLDRPFQCYTHYIRGFFENVLDKNTPTTLLIQNTWSFPLYQENLLQQERPLTMSMAVIIPTILSSSTTPILPRLSATISIISIKGICRDIL